MAPRTGRLWKLGPFLAGFLAVGVPFWRVPYADMELPTGLIGVGLGVVAIGALLARAVGRLPFFEALATAAAAVPVVVVVGIIVESLADRTSHNLAGIEVVMAVVVGLTAAGVGAVVGSAILAARPGSSTA